MPREHKISSKLVFAPIESTRATKLAFTEKNDKAKNKIVSFISVSLSHVPLLYLSLEISTQSMNE